MYYSKPPKFMANPHHRTTLGAPSGLFSRTEQLRIAHDGIEASSRIAKLITAERLRMSSSRGPGL